MPIIWDDFQLMAHKAMRDMCMYFLSPAPTSFLIQIGLTPNLNTTVKVVELKEKDSLDGPPPCDYVVGGQNAEGSGKDVICPVLIARP